MLPAPGLFQTPSVQQNSQTQRPFLLRNLRLPGPASAHHPLLAHLQRLLEGKKKPSDKELTTDSIILCNKSNLGFTPPALPRAVTQPTCTNTKGVRNTIRHAIPNAILSQFSIYPSLTNHKQGHK